MAGVTPVTPTAQPWAGICGLRQPNKRAYGSNRHIRASMAVRSMFVLLLAGLVSLSAAGQAGISSAAAVPDAAAVLTLHNKYRAKHGAAPLMWSNDIAATAAKHAKKCTWQHSTAEERNYNGENMYYSVGYDSRSIGARGTESWYEEVKDYNWNNPGTALYQDAMTGHFTQIVWRNTRAVGCAYVRCPTMRGAPYSNVDFLVCQYDPPGNLRQAYNYNVLPAGTPIKAAPKPAKPQPAKPPQRQVDTWRTAPSCNKMPKNGVKDFQGRLWGFENGKSCAYRLSATQIIAEKGTKRAKPSTGPAARPRKLVQVPAGGSGTKDAWDTAPACVSPYDGKNAAKDGKGRLWGYEKGVSCAYKSASQPAQPAAQPSAAASSTRTGPGATLAAPVTPAPAAALEPTSTAGSTVATAAGPAQLQVQAAIAGAPAKQQKWVDPWDTAPTCSKAVSNVVKDDKGRVWGYEHGASCAIRAAPATANATVAAATPPTTAAAAAAEIVSKPSDSALKPAVPAQQQATYFWESAPECKGKVPVGTKDDQGRIWGFEDGKSCAFKAFMAQPSGDMLVTAASGQPIQQEVKSSPAAAAVAAVVVQPVSDPWDTAPICKGKPIEGVIDNKGRLWGFEDGKSCALKSITASAAGAGVTAATANPGVQSTAAGGTAADGDTQAPIDDEPNVLASDASDTQLQSALNDASSLELFVDGWILAPACKAEAPANAVRDSRGRLWGFENGRTCAYKS